MSARRLLEWMLLSLCWLVLSAALPAADGDGWKAGVARAVITPTEPLWMAGYGGRTKPAEGKIHDLMIRVLALEDASGHRAVILSSDTLGISKPIYEAVIERCGQQHKLTRDQVMLNASHTHCGPVLKQALPDIYPLDDVQRQRVEAYSARLTDTIVETIGKAVSNLRPARVSRGLGTATFGVNRRTNREPDVPKLRAENLLQGPVDHSVPVLAVRTPDDKLLAVFFTYACHNTVMDFYQWSGDYAGFAQYALESRHPGCTALFAMGCGADQNPLPRRKIELAEQYGTQLADAVDGVLKAGTTPVSPKLATKIELPPLAFAPLPPQKTLEEMAAAPVNYAQRWATRMLEGQRSATKWPTEYPYPVQAWRLGDDLVWIALGGEVVVDYSLKFKGEFGWETWVIGYANDVMAYIPSYRVLLEGGYEGQSSMMVYGQPAERWGPDVEDRVTAAVRRVVKSLVISH